MNPDHTAPSDIGPPCLLLYLNKSVLLINYLQQTTSADDNFRCIFVGALRINGAQNQHTVNIFPDYKKRG